MESADNTIALDVICVEDISSFPEYLQSILDLFQSFKESNSSSKRVNVFSLIQLTMIASLVEEAQMKFHELLLFLVDSSHFTVFVAAPKDENNNFMKKILEARQEDDTYVKWCLAVILRLLSRTVISVDPDPFAGSGVTVDTVVLTWSLVKDGSEDFEHHALAAILNFIIVSKLFSAIMERDCNFVTKIGEMARTASSALSQQMCFSILTAVKDNEAFKLLVSSSPNGEELVTYAISLAKDTVHGSSSSAFKFLHACIENTAVRKMFLAVDHALLPIIVVQLSSPDLLSQKRAIHCMWMMCTSMAELKDIFVTNHDALNIVVARNLCFSSDANMRNNAFGFLSVLCGNEMHRQAIVQKETLVSSMLDLIFTEMNSLVQSKVINVVLTLATASTTVAHQITQREDTFLGSFITLDSFSNFHPTYVPRVRFVSSMVSKSILSREKFLVVSLQLADRIVQTVTTESDPSSLKAALTLCGSLNELREVQCHMVADPSQPFLNRLNHFVLTQPDLKADALNAASQLVFRSDEAQKAVFHSALLDTALSVIQGDAGDARTKALAMVYSMANNTDLKADLYHRGIVTVIVPFLRRLMQSPAATTDRNYATGILNVLTSKCTTNQIAFGDLDSGIVPLLIEVIRTDTSKARNFALSAFVSMAKAPENVWIFRDTSLGLLHAALDVARKESGDTAMYALSVIDEVVKSTESHGLAAQDRLDLNTILVRFIEETVLSTIQAKSLRILLFLNQVDGFQFTCMATKTSNAPQAPAASYSYNALELLQEYLLRMKTKLLSSSSTADHQLLLSNIHTLSCSSRIAAVSHAIMNPDLHLVPALFQLTESSSPHDVDLRASFSGFAWNIVENGDDATAQQMMPLRILQHGLRQIDAAIASSPVTLTAGEVATTTTTSAVSKPLDRIASNYLNLTMNLARHYEVREAIKAAGTVHVMKKLMVRSPGVDALRAMIVLLFLFGNEEATAGTSVSYVDGEDVAVTKERVQKLMTILETTLQSQRGDDYFLGTFCLPLILQACLVVAQSDSKKAWLLDLGCIPLLTKTLALYVNNQRSIPNCGGGGRDHESAALAIETLVHLSFHFDRSQDDTFRTTFLQQNMHLLELLPDIAHKEELIADAKQKAHRLYQRLTFTLPLEDLSAPIVTHMTIDPITSSSSSATAVAAAEAAVALAATAATSRTQGVDEDEVVGGPGAASRQHVMISYCWNPSAQPALVHQLGHELKRLGYDIWRDEEGSSLVPAMSGLIDDVMAEAIQCSHTIIICVSAAYKLSSNCRMEATYASTLARRQQVKLVYVMMNEQYTTVSAPEHCDGWLGFMIGSAYWHAMWDASYVAGVAAAIAKTLPSQTMLVRPSSTALSSISTSLSTTVDSVSIPSIENGAETPPPVVPPHGQVASRIAEERRATHVAALSSDVRNEPVAVASVAPTTVVVHSPDHSGSEPRVPMTPTAASLSRHVEHVTPTPTGRDHRAFSSPTTAARPDGSSEDPSWMIGHGSDSAFPPTLTTPVSMLRRTSSMSLSSSLSFLLPDDVVEQAWLLLQTPSLAIEEQQLLQHLHAEGILSPPLLASCDAEDVDRIATLLKKVPRRRFLLLMQHIRRLHHPPSDAHPQGEGNVAASAPQSLVIWVFLAVVMVLFILLLIAYAIIYAAITTRAASPR